MSFLPELPQGFDISHNNGGGVNFAKAAQAGKKFTAIKATQGVNFHDPYYDRNMLNAGKNGLKRAPYHFMSALADGGGQAKYLLDRVQPSATLTPNDLPIAGDVEADMHGGIDQWTKVPLNARESRLMHFFQTLYDETGKKSLLYTPHGWFDSMFPHISTELLSLVYLWLATDMADHGATDAAHATLPKLWQNGGTWDILQYSWKGTVPGVGEGSVDLDVARPEFFNLTFWEKEANQS